MLRDSMVELMVELAIDPDGGMGSWVGDKCPALPRMLVARFSGWRGEEAAHIGGCQRCASHIRALQRRTPATPQEIAELQERPELAPIAGLLNVRPEFWALYGVENGRRVVTLRRRTAAPDPTRYRLRFQPSGKTARVVVGADQQQTRCYLPDASGRPVDAIVVAEEEQPAKGVTMRQQQSGSRQTQMMIAAADASRGATVSGKVLEVFSAGGELRMVVEFAEDVQSRLGKRAQILNLSGQGAGGLLLEGEEDGRYFGTYTARNAADPQPSSGWGVQVIV